jgi:hypothetical protein
MEIPRKTSIRRAPIRNDWKRSRATNCGVAVPIDEGLSSYVPQRRCENKSVSRVVREKAAIEVIDGGFPLSQVRQLIPNDSNVGRSIAEVIYKP